MTPITRDEIEELGRKAKAATQEQWFIIDSTRTPNEFRVGGDGPIVFENPENKIEWSILVGEDGYSVVYGGSPREDASDEILAALDHIAAACPRATLRLIARIRELESACVGMADRLEEYCGELVADGMTKEAANVRRIWVTLREAAKGGA